MLCFTARFKLMIPIGFLKARAPEDLNKKDYKLRGVPIKNRSIQSRMRLRISGSSW